MRFVCAKNFKRNQGFTLVQVGVLITILGLVAASIIPGGRENSAAAQYQTTQARIGVIQQAMRSYIASHGALPCPAVGYTDIGVDTFGTAATSGTSCDSTNLLNNGNTYIGIVPVKTIGLPDQMAFDGFGRKFSYAADGRTVTNVTCKALQDSGTRGSLDIRSTAAGSTYMNAMWLLLSHGQDGHGAYPQNGVTDSTYRINSGSTDTDTLTNANAVSNSTVGAVITASVDAVFVRKNKTTAFDDLLWTDPLYANKCALGTAAARGVLFTDDASAVAGSWDGFAVGDINGDGYGDIIEGRSGSDFNSRNNSGSVYIMFGSSGAVTSGTAMSDSGTSPTRIRIDGTSASNGLGLGATSGDVNGDGIDDLVISSSVGYIYLLLGRSSWSSATDISTLVNGSTGFRFDGANTYVGRRVAVADVNGDGLGDIIISDDNATVGANALAGRIYVLFGRRTAWPSSTQTLAGDLTSPTDYVIYSDATANDYYGYYMTTGDINGDGYADVIAAAPTACSGDPCATYGSVYVVYGKASPVDVAVGSLSTSTGVTLTSDTNLTFGINANSSSVQGPTGLAAGDFNGDGYDDIAIEIPQADDSADTRIAASQIGIFYIVYGAASYAATTYSLDPSSGSTIINGTAGFYVGGLYASGTTGLQNTTTAFADLNGDGFKDALLTQTSGMWVLWGRNTTASAFANTTSSASFFNPSNASYIARSSNSISAIVPGRLNRDAYQDLYIYAGASYQYAFYGRKRNYFPGTSFSSGTTATGILYLDNY